MLNSPAWQRQRSLYRKMYLSSDYPLCFTSYNFFCLFLWHTDMAAFSTGLTVRSEVTFIDKGLILSLLWDQRSIHVEWECEHPVLPVSSPTHPQRITVCVCVTFSQMWQNTHMQSTHLFIITWLYCSCLHMSQNTPWDDCTCLWAALNCCGRVREQVLGIIPRYCLVGSSDQVTNYFSHIIINHSEKIKTSQTFPCKHSTMCHLLTCSHAFL